MTKLFKFTGVLTISGDELTRQEAQHIARAYENVTGNLGLQYHNRSVKFVLLPGVARTSE